MNAPHLGAGLYKLKVVPQNGQVLPAPTNMFDLQHASREIGRIGNWMIMGLTLENYQLPITHYQLGLITNRDFGFKSTVAELPS
jgi:hypothetical protein